MRVLFIVLILVALCAGLWYAEVQYSAPDENPVSVEPENPKNEAQLVKTEEQPSEPVAEPLLLEAVNVLRAEYGLSPLKRNAALMQVAATRLFDMRDREYFAHVSPLGESAASVAAQAGYAYLHIGENLARGAFRSSAEVVEHWLASELHVNSLLSKGYIETGIAVGPSFEDQPGVIVVQIFAVPLDYCTPPDTVLSEELQKNTELLATLGFEVEDFRDPEPTVDAPADVLELVEITQLLRDRYQRFSGEYSNCLSSIAAAVESTPDTFSATRLKSNAK